MCRALIYGGRPLLVDDLLYSSPMSLVHQAYAPRQLESLNLAGFGLAAWDARSHAPDEPWLYRTVAVPVYDRNLKSLAAKVQTSCMLAHVRGIPYRPEANFSDTNLHPFHYPGQPWHMAHNGDLVGLARMRHDLLRHMLPDVSSRIEGTTDSEAVYALVMSQLAELDDPASVTDLTEAIRRSLRVLRQVRRAHDLSLNSSLNLFFTNGRDLVALRYVFDFGHYALDATGDVPSSARRFLSLWATVGDRFVTPGFYPAAPPPSPCDWRA